jgi:tripartite-type tricarboxylate transporter receptor subunit TctC
VAQVLGRKETTDKLGGEGIRVMPMSQRDFSAYVVADLTRWRTIVKERGLQET